MTLIAHPPMFFHRAHTTSPTHPCPSHLSLTLALPPCTATVVLPNTVQSHPEPTQARRGGWCVRPLPRGRLSA